MKVDLVIINTHYTNPLFNYFIRGIEKHLP